MFLIFIYLFIFWLRLGLHCCAQDFSSCGEHGLLFVSVHGRLIAVASLVVEHGLQAHRLQQLWHVGSVVAACGPQRAQASVVVVHGLSSCGARVLGCMGFSSCGAQSQQLWLTGMQAQQLWHTGLVALRHVGSSRIRAQTCVPCIGRRVLNHCATTEVPGSVF